MAECLVCKASNPDGKKFCGDCGAQITVAGLIAARDLHEKIKAVLKEELKDQKVVEIEVAEAIADRVTRWTKLFGFASAVPLAILVLLLGWFGITKTADLRDVAKNAEATITSIASDATNKQEKLKQLQPQIDAIEAASKRAANLEKEFEGKLAETEKGFNQKVAALTAEFEKTVVVVDKRVSGVESNLEDIKKAVEFRNEAQKVSGAACYIVGGERKSCLLIDDDAKYAQFFSIRVEPDGTTLVPGDKIFLLPERDSNDQKFNEADAEGIAFAKDFYYIVGSHGLNLRGVKQPSRYFVYRVRIDPVTGRPSDLGSATTASASVERTTTLDALIAADPVLKDYIDKTPRDQNGVKIEGLAVSGDDMFFGFRGPVMNDTALVRQVPIKAIFDGKTAPLQPHSLRLGRGMGIRDLAAVKDGFLVLSGPEESKPGKAEVFFWKPGAEPIALQVLGGHEGQPEVLMVLAETHSAYSVLVMSQGPGGGEPMRFEIAKK